MIPEGITLDDFFVTCEKCKGEKNISERSSGSTGFGMHSSISFGPCDQCNGKGGHLTENGEVLKQFIQMVKNCQV
jgi:hypothetical protein